MRRDWNLENAIASHIVECWCKHNQDDETTAEALGIKTSHLQYDLEDLYEEGILEDLLVCFGGDINKIKKGT